MKEIRHFGANVIACQLDKGERRWYIVGCYLAPGYGVTTRYVEATMKERLRGEDLIITRDFNVDLERTDGRGWDEEIAAAIEMAGIEDI